MFHRKCDLIVSMKRRSFLRYTLELIVILGYLVLGVTIFTFIFQKVPFDKIFIGSLILAIGVLEFTDYITWKYSIKMKNIQYFVGSMVSIALGIIFMVIKMDAKALCYFWGAFSIFFSLVKISTGSISLVYQPLICSVRIVLAITRIVFSILLLARTLNALNPFILFVGISLAIEAVILFIEFMIHRYQRI